MNITLINENKMKIENFITTLNKLIEKLKVSLSEKEDKIITLEKQHKKFYRTLRLVRKSV